MAGDLRQLHTGGFAQTEALGGFIDLLDGQKIAQFVEEVVAGNFQGVLTLDLAVGGVDGGVKQTLGIEVFVPGEHTLILDLGIQIDDTVVHGGGEGNHFEGGAGGIGRLEGTVEHGGEGGLLDLVVLLHEVGQIIGGIAGAGQNVAGFDLHNDDGGTLGITADVVAHFRIQVRVGQIGHDVCQGILGNLLDVDVQGGLYVVARHRLLTHGVFPGDDGAVLVHLVDTGAVDGMKLFFEGLFKAALTDEGVHGVALFLIFRPLVCVDGTHGAQDMGGVLGVVLPDSGGFHVQAGGVQLQQGGQGLVGHVLDEDEGGQVGDIAQVQLVAQADDRPAVLVGPIIGDLVGFAQLLDQQGRGDIRVQIHPVLAQELLEVPLPGIGILVDGVLKGAALRHGEVVGVVNAQFPALFHQLIQGFVGVAGGDDNVVVKHQVITGPVAHQDVAVAVQDVAPGGFDTGHGGKGGGVVGVALGVDDLQAEQLDAVQRQNAEEDTQQHPGSEFTYSFHGSPPMEPILKASG